MDDEDGHLAQYRWCACVRRNGRVYAKRGVGGRKDQKTVLMHRVILGIEDKAIDVDHWDGNGLNNRRDNLRRATRSQNIANKGKAANNTTGYKGVTACWNRRDGSVMYRAQIKVNQRHITLGHSQDIIALARIYDEAAIRYFGEFARPNFPKGTLT